MSNDTELLHASVIKRIWKKCKEEDVDIVAFAWRIQRESIRAAVEASARQLAEQPGHLLIAAERWAQLEHMWSRNATPETIASYIGRPEILDRISKIRREHEAAVQGNAA